MANSRLEKIGTIFSRITGLLRSGGIKPEDRPIWYDVYKHFPPKYPPRYDRPEPENKITKIFYPEDVIRARIHKKKSIVVGSVNLSDSSKQTNTQRCLALYEKLKNEGLDETAALNQAIEEFATEKYGRQKQPQNEEKLSIAEEFKRSKAKPPSVNMSDVMKND